MKIKSVLINALGLFAICLLFSCKKDESPVVLEEMSVVIKEVGANNSKIAYTGHDLHLDAAITAPGKIANIKLQITLAETNYGWDLIKTYTANYVGLKSVNFHEHVDVPENARIGTYTLLLIVTDESGKKTQSKINFEVRRDLTLPVINELSLKISPSVIDVSGQINATNKIKELKIEVQSAAWTKDFFFTDGISGKQSHLLSERIDISMAPAGHYHVNFTLTDQEGKRMTYSYHFDKT